MTKLKSDSIISPVALQSHKELDANVSRLFGIKPKEVAAHKVVKIAQEFIKGYKLLKKYRVGVSIFGSARCGFHSKIYQEAERLAYELAKQGCAVITGGGPGIMEAANRGAKKAKGHSVGLNIKLAFEQKVNSFVTDSADFNYFFIRKVMLASAGKIYVFFPGGYGTMDELFEMLTLVQTKKIKPIPIILVNKKFWRPLLKWFEQSLYKQSKAIGESDLKLYYLADDAKEALKLINSFLTAKQI